MRSWNLCTERLGQLYRLRSWKLVERRRGEM